MCFSDWESWRFFQSISTVFRFLRLLLLLLLLRLLPLLAEVLEELADLRAFLLLRSLTLSLALPFFFLTSLDRLLGAGLTDLSEALLLHIEEGLLLLLLLRLRLGL